jgi:hypothetical protein
MGHRLSSDSCNIAFILHLFCGTRSTILEVRLDTFFYFGCKWGAFIKVVDKKDHFNSKILIYTGLNLGKKDREQQLSDTHASLN